MRKTFVKTKNVKEFIGFMEELKSLPPNIPKIALVYGDYGLGKSETIKWWTFKNDCVYVRATKGMSVRWLLSEIAEELGEEAYWHSQETFNMIENKLKQTPKNLNGICPDELFYNEYTEKITPSRDALKLFCMRTSRNFTIGRNGIQDRQLGITYWADWMITRSGLKVYLRRDVQDYKEAWAFKAYNDEFVGTVKAVKAVAALHADKVSKEEFKEALSIKKRNLKITKAYIKQSREISLEEQYKNYKAAYDSTNKDYKKSIKVSKIANTNMDKAIQKNKEMESFGRQDLSVFLEDNKPEEKLYLFETDKILEKERIEMEAMRAKAL